MGDGVTISLGDTLPYLETRLLELIGKDQASNELKSWFSALQQTAIIQASSVKCIGMHRPIPLNEIYQPTRLKVKGLNLEKRASLPFQDRMSRSIAQAEALYEHVLTVGQFLSRGENAIVYAGPGWGKTTFSPCLSFLGSAKGSSAGFDIA